MALVKSKYAWWVHFLFTPHVVVYTLVFILFLIKALGTLDPDFGWHLQSGRYILEHGIPTHDIFTYTVRDFPWIHHEWLADVLSASIYQVGGYWLLGFVFASLWTTSVWLVSRKNPLPIVTLIATCVMLSFSGVRAMTWTVFFCAILHILLHRRGRAWRWIPLLMLFWANMHGGFVLGLAYIAWRFFKEHSFILAGVMITSVLVTFITPYGPGMYLEVWRTLVDSDLHTNIQEWSSFALTIPAITVVGIWVGVRAMTVSPWWRAIVSFETLLLIASFSSIRSLPLFCLFALGWLSITFKKMKINRSAVSKLLRPINGLISIVAVVFVLVMVTGVYDALKGVKVDPESSQPQKIIQALRDRPCEGAVFNSYNIGGYFIWKLPNTPVYIDGRMPSWEHDGKKYMNIYKDVLTNSNVQKREFSIHNIKCVVMEERSDIIKRLQHDGWRHEITDRGYTLSRRGAV